MNEAEYVLKLILRARDELSTKLAKVRTELQGLDKDTKGASAGFDDLNKKITSANTRIGNLTDKVKEARQAFRELTGDSDKVGKSSKSMAADVDNAAESVADMAEKIADANKKLEAMREAHRRTDEEMRKGTITRDQAAKSYQRISQELDQLAKKTPVASKSFFDVTDLANRARESQKVIRDSLTAEDKLRSDSIKKLEADRDAATARGERAVARSLEKEIQGERDRASRIVQERKDAENEVLGIIEEELAKARQARTVSTALDIKDAQEAAARRKGILDAEHEDELDSERQHNTRLRTERAQAENEFFDLIANLNNQVAQGRKVDNNLELADVREQAERLRILREADHADEEESERRHQNKIRDERVKAEQEVFDLIASLSRGQGQGRKVDDLIDVGDVNEAANRLRELRRAEAEQEEESSRAHQREQVELEKNVEIHNKLWDSVERNRQAYEKWNREVGSSTSITSEQRGELSRIGSEFRKLGNSFDVGSEHARTFGDVASRVGDRLKSFDTNVDKSGNVVSRFGHTLDEWSNKINSAGDSIASFDNNLRGMALLAAIGFGQQFLTVILGLVGGLANLAGSAAMAGAAIGGAFIAGIAQGLPILGIFAAALMRVKAVMDAVQQAQLVQQQQSQRAAKAGQAETSQANSIASAQDGVTDALEGVADARRRVADAVRNVGDAEKREEDQVERLRDARRQGRRELEDLILAEKRAELQARGAVLSQSEAQEQFRQTITEGGSLADFQRNQLDVASSALDLEDAARNKRRQGVDTGRAVAGGVEGLDSVEQAKKGVADARRSVQDAVRSVDDAERAVGRSQRSVDRARRNLENAQITAAKGTSDVFAGAEKLDFMLSKLSPAERKLFTEFNTFADRWRKVSGEFTEPLITSFTKATHKVNQLLLDPELVGAARDLAGDMSKQFDRVWDHFTSPSVIHKIEHFMDEAGKNLEPIGDIIIDLGDAFGNIADAASPSLHRLLGWFDDLAGKILKLTEDKNLEDFFDKATDNAIAWFELAESVIELFAALISGGAADEGLTSVEDLTKKIRDATGDIKKNADGVRKFFHDSRSVMDDVIDVVIAIGKELIKTFNPETAHNFADFMIKVLIPAVGEAIRTIGRIMDFLTQVADIPGIGFLLGKLIELLVIAKVSTGIFGLFGGLVGTFGKLTRGVGWIGTVLTGLGGMIAKIPGLGRLGTALERVGRAQATGAAAASGAGGAAASTARRPGETGAQHLERLRTGEAPAGGRLARAGSAVARGLRNPAVGLGAGLALSVGGNALGNKVGGVGGSAIKGATTGASIGLLFGPEGAAIGGALGAGVGLLQGLSAKGAKDRADGVKDLAKQLDAATKKRDASGITDVAKQAKLAADEARKFGDQDLAKQYDDIGKAATRNKDAVDKWGHVLQTLGDDKHRVKADDIVDPQAVNEFNDNITRMKTHAFTGIKDIRDNMKFNVDKIDEGLKTGTHSWQNSMTENFGSGIDAVKSAMADGSISVTAGVKEIHRITGQQMAFARDNMDTMSADGKDRLAKNYRAARVAIRDEMAAGVLSTSDGMKEIRRLMTAELETYGLSPEQAARLARNRTSKTKQDVNQFGQNEGTGGGGKAIGGWLGKRGQRGYDTMRHRVAGAAAAAGEAVLNFAHIPTVNDALEGQFGFNLDQMFERTRGYHRGGPGQGGFAAGGSSAPIDVKGSKPGFAVFMQLFRQLFGDRLYVLSGSRPGSRVSGSGVLSNHSAGNAIDISWPGVDRASQSNPPENINPGGAGRMDRLHAYIASHIHKPPILDFLWRTTTGGNHYNHIHLGLAETVTRTITAARNFIKTLGRDVTATAGGAADPSKASVKRVLAKGPESPFKSIRQAALDSVRRAANVNLRDTIDTFGQTVPDGTTASADTKVPADVGSIGDITDERSWAIALLRAMKIDRSASSVANMTRWAKAEGGHFVNKAKFNPLNTTLNMPGSGDTGVQGNISVYKDWAQGITATIRTLSHYPGILDVLRKGGGRDAFRNAVYSSPWGTKSGLAQGGIIPAILHAGEHVWTAAEVARAGGHGAMRAMRSMFGGGGQSTGGSFADGGAAEGSTSTGTAAQELLNAALPITTKLDTARVRATFLGVFKLGTRVLNDFDDVAREANNFLRAIKVLSHSAQTRVANLARRLVGFASDVDKDDRGEFREISKAINKLRKGGVTDKEKGKLKSLRDRMLKLTPDEDDDEAKAIFAEMDRLDEIVKIRGQISTLRKRGKGKPESGRVQTLKAKLSVLEGPDRSRFVGNIDELTKEGGVLSKMDDARTKASSRAARALTFATFGVQAATGVLAGGGFRTQITTPEAGTAGATALAQTAAQNAGANLGRIQTQEGITTTALGKVQGRLAQLRQGGVSKKEAVEYAQLSAQLVNLQNQFGNIRDAHAQALQDLYAAQQAYIQAVKDQAQKAVTDINENARRQLFDTEITGRQAAVSGDRNLAQQANAAKRNIIGAQINQLGQASVAIYNAFGANSNEYRAIVEQVADLRLQIAESLKQDLLDRISDVEAATERSNAAIGRSGRLADVVARFGVGGTGAANPVLAAQQRLGITRQSGDVLQNERNQLQQLMQTAAAQGNWDVYRDLGDKIADLDVSIVENTAAQREAATAVRQATIDQIQARAGFRTGVFGGLGNILQTLGAITGQPDIGRQRSLLNLTSGTLQRQGTDLRSELKGFGIDLTGLSGTSLVDAISKLDFDKIESTMSEPDRKQFEDLVNAVVENENATQQNTQQLKDLNNPSNVQSFSSSAWRMFRAAIFTGTGGVIPGFSNVPSFQGGGIMPHDGIARLHAGERIIPVNGENGGDTNVYITSPTETADPDYFASRLDWNLRGRGRR